MMDSLAMPPEELYPTFRYPCLEDVTAVYAGKQNYTVQISPERIYPSVRSGEMLYLCSSCKMDWIPIAWCRAGQEGAVFKDLEGQMVFRVASYEEGSLRFRTDPFILERTNGEVRFSFSG